MSEWECVCVIIILIICFTGTIRHSYGFDNTDEDEQKAMLADRKKMIIEQSKTHPIIIGSMIVYYVYATYLL